MHGIERKVQQLVSLGTYNHSAIKDAVHALGIDYNRLEIGIAHFFNRPRSSC